MMYFRSLFNIVFVVASICASTIPHLPRLDHTLSMRNLQALFNSTSNSTIQAVNRAKDLNDPCADLGSFPNTGDRYDCTRVRSVDSDGNCPVKALDTATSCNSYCEVRRQAFIGKEIQVAAIGTVLASYPPGIAAQLSEGIEFSIEQSVGLSLGAGALNGAISAGVSFSYAVTETNTKSIAITGIPSDTYASQWVAFPIFISTCGTMTQSDKKTVPQVRGPSIPVCDIKQNLKTTHNVCSTVPWRDAGTKPLAAYALRYFDTDGIAPMDKQHSSYKFVCLKWASGGGCKAASSPDAKVGPGVVGPAGLG